MATSVHRCLTVIFFVPSLELGVVCSALSGERGHGVCHCRMFIKVDDGAKQEMAGIALCWEYEFKIILSGESECKGWGCIVEIL